MLSAMADADLGWPCGTQICDGKWCCWRDVCVAIWSRTQASYALSSCEFKLYAAVEVLGVVAFLVE